MKWHCGLLDEHPYENPTYRWVTRGGFFRPEFPEAIRHELAILLAMPGFPRAFFASYLRLSDRHIDRVRKKLPGYEELRNEVAENWLSVTREDAIKLCHMRLDPRSAVPLVVQLQILDDIKAGIPQAHLAREYGISLTIMQVYQKKGPQIDPKSLPRDFGWWLNTT